MYVVVVHAVTIDHHTIQAIPRILFIIGSALLIIVVDKLLVSATAHKIVDCRLVCWALWVSELVDPFVNVEQCS